MTMAEIDKDDLITIHKTAKITGVNLQVIKYHIEAGNIESMGDMIHKSVCNLILQQKATFIGIKAFLKEHDNDRFESKYVKNRNKYIDFLEENDYFGIEIMEPKKFLFELPEREDFFITKEDAQFLEFKSEQFFNEFGYTEKEKVKEIINHSKDHVVSTKYIKKYLNYIEDEDNIFTPALTAFVRMVFDMPDIKQLTDEDIIDAIDEEKMARTKALFLDYLKFVARYENMKYHNIELKKKESNSIPAYSYKDFVDLAKILFNTDYDKEHNLTLKALESSKYTEMWMFLSCHYICGWRSSAICDRWVYPDLKSNDNPFNINIFTITDNRNSEPCKDEPLYAGSASSEHQYA